MNHLNTKLIKIIEESLLVSIDVSNQDKIVFSVLNVEDGEISRFNVYILSTENFYYQRYGSSLQRSGFRNLNRIEQEPTEHEWIKSISEWRNVFTKENGVAIQMYNGKIMRFVGNALKINHTYVENGNEDLFRGTEKPDKVLLSDAKITTNESIKKYSRPLTSEVDTIESDISEDLAPNRTSVLQEQLDRNDYDANETQIYLEPTDNHILEDALQKIDNLTEKKPDESSLLDQIGNYVPPIDHDLSAPSSLPNDIVDNEDVTRVDGVLREYKIYLAKLGYTDIEKLSKATISQLTSIKGIGKATARKIIQSSKQIIDETL